MNTLYFTNNMNSSETSKIDVKIIQRSEVVFSCFLGCYLKLLYVHPQTDSQSVSQSCRGSIS